MLYSLEKINNMAAESPTKFIEECTARYQGRISEAADCICKNMAKSPVVLLSGPSGSGKTTTAKKLEDELERRGVNTYTISMDNYFLTVDPKTAPRTSEGEIDYESPLCLDMELLSEHFSLLAAGQRIRIPYFMFARQKRSSTKFTFMQLKENEIAIFEGIHAFNDAITKRHPEAFELYISAESGIDCDGRIFKSEWTRLVRRVVRDHKFRGADAEFTLKCWKNVLHGEEKYILPNKYKADLELDSSLEYEIPVLKRFALPLFQKAEKAGFLHPELTEILRLLPEFCDIDSSLVKSDSLLCEFIGGGIYSF